MTRPLDRLIVLFASVCLVLLGMGFIVVAFGWNPMSFLTSFAQRVMAHRIEFGLGGLITMLAGWHLVFYAVGPEEERGVVRETALGQIKIQYRALENLVVRTIQDLEGIRDVEARIQAQDSGVNINVSLNIEAEQRIPELSDVVQARVEEVIRDKAGVDIQAVAVEVRNISERAKTAKVRVE